MEMSDPESEWFKVRIENGVKQVFDPLRKKYLVLTPEEEVRQRFIHYLVVEKKYPIGLIAQEYQITLNKTSKRCDVVVFDKTGTPSMIVECKAPSVTITNNAFQQIGRYNIVLKVPYLVVTNGHTNYAMKLDLPNKKSLFLKEIPAYEDL